jgi:hypothetical protein
MKHEGITPHEMVEAGDREIARLRMLLYARAYCEGNKAQMKPSTCKFVGCWWYQDKRCKVDGELVGSCPECGAFHKPVENTLCSR